MNLLLLFIICLGAVLVGILLSAFMFYLAFKSIISVYLDMVNVKADLNDFAGKTLFRMPRKDEFKEKNKTDSE